ncbi:MAG TPA: alcohol dehydrogenase catalytic domain-containing protein [Amaricoccus sp.]|uniref:zinc-binding dehydrogenase n=1 Tax=Amaricoccus sp. TaxID=1872485 RepID=UPI002C376A5F|nr:alcohol dehydrogenase catalytic domain-containing protein [Amaricoccus sp.]HMQ94328.1 alcohol dehydrogenase catalytic domain-containing protein [Amaricoccus sp.]HMR52922.1 alcohol dehydrogenase catalytic domain-containing protein [Amaricoccus sp.]HMR60843.1 alcohol dehydrogenase catalytic domain-containing protein [Amaricoccus sp.]HMT99817.1 alcohol dehydrogenase catalytic domain-containing protein [Amaricoccus sp.]
MRAAVLRAYNADLSIEDLPDPAPEADGVVLRTIACGICRSDWHGWTGEHPRVKPGQIQGHEYCGEVVEAGPLSAWKPGDRVVAPFILACGRCPACQSGHQNTCPDQRLPGFVEPGAFAEYVAVPLSHNLARLPETLSPTVAAGLGCRVTTAWHALTGRAELRAGEWLAVHGTGGIGLATLLLGKALGARVVVVDVVPEKLAHARGFGADAAIDARDGDTAAAIVDLTGGGADVSVEALGIAQTTNASIECLAPLGRHVQVGMPVGHTARMEINMNAVYMKNLALYGTRGMPSWRYPSLLALIEQGAVDFAPLIAREVRLSEASDELRAFNGPTAPGVAVITDFSQ